MITGNLLKQLYKCSVKSKLNSYQIPLKSKLCKKNKSNFICFGHNLGRVGA